jgi:pyridoxal phosphate enzyme (YggS family)
MNIITNFEKIKQEIKSDSIRKNEEIVAVSKTFSLDHVMPLINHGHRHFGENKVQEAEKKWKQFKNTNRDLKLHMIGRLQSNKAKKAVELFDYIHSLDSEKLANELSKRQKEKGKNLDYFIQINLGSEEQKGGVDINNLKPFINYCKNKLKLSIIGLMAIPPNNNETEKYFKRISDLNKQFNLEHLSIGMSNDYLLAIKYGATFVRIGSAIFGSRS